MQHLDSPAASTMQGNSKSAGCEKWNDGHSLNSNSLPDDERASLSLVMELHRFVTEAATMGGFLPCLFSSSDLAW